MAVNTLGLNRTFPIYNADGTSFNNLELHKAVVDSIVMSLGDKITGEVYYKDNSLAVTMHEYIDYNGVRYMLVNPPTVVREGMVSDNGQLNGMTKYSFEFYHPMYLLGNIPFNDVAVTADETRYLSENAVFSWIGYPDDLIAKLNKNLQGTEWIVVKSSRFPNEKDNELSEVIPFNNAMISDVLKTFYDTWEVPFVIGQVESTEAAYAQGKRFKVIFGLPYNEIYETPEDRSGDIPFVFQFGQGVGLKNNSRNPRNNKIVTRIAGYGAERNVPYGYPQIPWYGDSRWDWTEYEGDVINYDINDKVTNNPKSTAYPIYDGIVSGQPTRLIKHPFTRTHLMPSIYGKLLFNKVSPYISGGGVNPSYNPNIQLKDFYDAIATQEYPYINEINPSSPSYQFKEFEKIYPELGEEYIYGVQPLNDDLTPAPDWDDSIDNDGNYNQSYFAITLPILSFDIYASAAVTEEMEINMRSGACLGCTFQVQVDWEDYKNNFFNSDGEFDPVPHTAENDGHVRDAKKYPDSSQTRVTVIVKKDLETFGTLMPNIYQYPIAGDQFVVLGISMPQSYISNAEARLDAEMKTYMLENNVYYFDYPLKFDEKFLRDNTYILSQLRPNSIVRFNYAGQQLQLYVKQLTVKYGEKPLPQYDITLTDNVEVVLNQLGQVADDVERLSTLISIVRENYSRSVWAELAKKLSKVDDDTAQGTIRFLKGLQVGSRFVSGLLGSGGIFRRNADGKTYLETDNLYVRMKAYFDTVEVREYEHSHGGRIASSAGQKVSHVIKMGYYPEGSQTKVPLDDNNNYHYIDPVTGDETLIPLDVCCYRCYYRAKENRDTTEQATRQNTFKRGDMARCHMVNNSLNQKDYWRIVDETNEYDTFYNGEYGWTDLTNEAHFDVTGTSTCWGYMGASSGEAADVPEMGDDLYQLGSVTDADRQGAIVEATTGNDTPAYRIYQSLGKDLRPTPAQGQPPLSEFDPFTLEDRDYIDLFYNSATGRAQMDVYGDAYIGSKDRSTTYIKYTQDDGTQQHRPKLEIKALINVLSSVLDGNTTYNSLNDYLSAKTYTQAQVDAMIEGIQEQIDGEIDTWFYDYMPVDFEATEPANKVPLLFYEKDGVSYPCQPYYDWFVADHGDPTTTPITQPTTDVERNKHLGDIFYDNTSGYAFRFSKDENTGDFEWVEITDSAVIKALRDAANAQDTADNKRRVFVAQPAPIPPKTYVEYDVGDLWTNANFTGSDSHGQAVVYSNDLLRCITAKPIRDAQDNITDGTFSIDDWQLASKYTDDTALTNFIGGAYATTISLLQGQVDKKAQTWYQDQNPATTAAPNGWYVQGENHDAEHVGDLWYCTVNIVDPNTQEVVFGKDTTWYFQVDNTGSTPRYYWQQQNIPFEVFDKIDGKCQIFVNDPTATPPSYPTNYQSEDLWILPQAATINGVSYIQGEILTSTADSDIYVASHWVKKVGYTNDDTVNAIIQRYGQILNITPTAQDLGQALGYLEKVLSTGSTSVDGGLVLTNIIYMKDVGTTPQVRAGLSGLLKETETGTGWKGYGTAAWYGGGVNNGVPIDKEASPTLSNYAKSLFRFDGSGYLAGGNITWDANGSVTIRNITTLYDSQNTNILNELTTFSNMFGNSTWGVEPNTELRIQPKQHFDHINLTRGTGSVGGDSHYFDITDVSVLNYGEMKTRFLQSDLFWLLFGVYSSDGTTDLTSTFVSTGALPTGAVIKAKTGLFTDSFLSALSLNPNSGGGGGTGDVTWTALAQTATDNRTIDWSYIANAVTQQGYITSALLAAYLSTNGYATQSWVGQQGYITSSSLNGYATESWVNSLLANYYTKSQVDSLTWLQGISQEESGLLTISVHGGEGYILDLTHSHSFYEIVNRPNTLNGYGITDALNSSTTFWGQNAISGGNVSGSIEAGNNGGSIGGFHSIELNSHGTLPDYGGYVDFHFNGSSSGFTSRIIEKASGIVSIESISTAGLVVGGSNGDFVQIGAIRIGYDSANNALKVYKIVSGSEVAANLYALGGISALGYGVSGGSGSGDVTWTALAQTAASGRFIDWSYIETAVTAQGYITTALLATYLSTSGYATQSWVQSLGYVTQSWVQSQGYVTNAVNDISWVADGVLRFAVTNGNNIDIDFNHTHSWYDLNNRPDIDRAFVNLFDDATHFSRVYADNDGLNVSFTNASGSLLSVNGDLEATGEIYESNARVATRTWVGLNYTNTTDLQTMLGNYLLKSGGTMTGTLYMGVGTYFRLYEDANSYASIYANATDGLSIGFNNGATVAAINLDANTEIGGTLGVTGNVTVGHPNTNGGYIQIGGVRLVYDSVNNALYVVSSDGSTAAHFYATGGVSALGNGISGGGGGGTGDVTWTALAAQATNNRTIHSSYIADTLANYLLVSGGTVTGDLTLLGNVFATSAAFNINRLYLTTGFRIQMVDRTGNDNTTLIAFDTNNNLVLRALNRNVIVNTSNLLVGNNTVWHGGNFPLAVSSPTSGQVLKFNGTSWVNDTVSVDGIGDINWVTDGVLRFSKANGNVIDVDFNHTHSWYDLTNKPDIDKAHISLYDDTIHYVRIYSDNDGLNVSFTNASGSQLQINGDLLVMSEIYESDSRIATRSWVQSQGYVLSSALNGYLPLSAGTSYPIAGTLCLSAMNEIRLYQDATRYAKIVPDTSDGLTIGFSSGNTLNQLNLPSNTYIDSEGVASQEWVGRQGFAYTSQIPTVPTAVSAFINDVGYITISALTGYATQSWVTNTALAGFATQNWVMNTALSGYATQSWVQSQGYVSNAVNNITWVSDGLLEFVTSSGNNIKVDFNHTHSWYDLTNKPDIDKAHISLYDDTIHYVRIYSDNDGLNVSFTNASGSQLYVSGDLYVSGTIDSGSDSRRKNITEYDVEPNLWDIAYAPTVRFTWKDMNDNREHLGSVAQYWQIICPECVNKNSKGYLGMQYDVIALLSVISIAKKTVEHERRISELERENAILRNRIETLEAA